MTHTARVVRILIASPGDVEELRKLIPPLFIEWNTDNQLQTILHPTMWEHESVPALGDHPQNLLDEQLIEESDLLVAIFWSKLGTPTRKALSGTIQEIESFIEIKGPNRVMLYYWEKPLDLSPSQIDTVELQRLQEFRQEMQEKGLYHEFKTEAEFEKDLYRHLKQKVSDLLNNKLPLPAIQTEISVENFPTTNPEKWPIGDSLEAVSGDFNDHLETMMARGDKYGSSD